MELAKSVFVWPKGNDAAGELLLRCLYDMHIKSLPCTLAACKMLLSARSDVGTMSLLPRFCLDSGHPFILVTVFSMFLPSNRSGESM